MYKNMKISITDETHLKAVCEVLETLGYKQDSITSGSKRTVCTWASSGTYDCYDMTLEQCFHHDEVTTLTDLLHMCDEMVKDGAMK